MKKILMLAVLLVGCSSNPSFKDGTITTLGAYLPWDGQLYGCQIISYVNGCVIRTPSNMCYQVERKHSVTNDWCWGMLKSVETSDTKVTLNDSEE